jgi:hypothetical protein
MRACVRARFPFDLFVRLLQLPPHMMQENWRTGTGGEISARVPTFNPQKPERLGSPSGGREGIRKTEGQGLSLSLSLSIPVGVAFLLHLLLLLLRLPIYKCYMRMQCSSPGLFADGLLVVSSEREIERVKLHMHIQIHVASGVVLDTVPYGV